MMMMMMASLLLLLLLLLRWQLRVALLLPHLPLPPPRAHPRHCHRSAAAVPAAKAAVSLNRGVDTCRHYYPTTTTVTLIAAPAARWEVVLDADVAWLDVRVDDFDVGPGEERQARNKASAKSRTTHRARSGGALAEA